MKGYSFALTIISGLALTFIYNHQMDAPTLGICVALFAMSLALVIVNDEIALLTHAGLSLLFIGSASYSLAHNVWWMEAPLTLLFPVAVVGCATMVYTWVWAMSRRMAHHRNRVRRANFVDEEQVRELANQIREAATAIEQGAGGSRRARWN